MAWLSIEKTFQTHTTSRRITMSVQLHTLIKGSLPMLEYLQQKRSLVDSLVDNLDPISDVDLVSYILTGLNSSYGPFSTTFMMKSDYVSVDDLLGYLLQEEDHLEQEHSRQGVIMP